ncbi:KlaA protein [Desulfosarcina ovata subsp. sediminis]|uniref:KlaA protein n=1 Tax=Desulfosarcina ovata subsp. sediminis TaxID=885957 RepID=A0A5K7ZYY4_9BACT|nr:toxic anion resistance protein [Desulfosarcina ovata]BBO85310.1 KlaA protein [Desulfosarcina ovata subsp. sediminis]
MTATPSQTGQALVLADPLAIRHDVELVDPQTITVSETPDPQLDQQATAFVQAVLTLNPGEPASFDACQQNKAAVENLGSKSQKEAAHRSAMLKDPISKLAARGEDGGEVANALVNLKMTVEDLDPGQFDFKAGWFSRTLGFLPGVGTPLKRFFTRFESSQTVIDAIMRSLEEGKKVLQRDNVTLNQDQKAMRELTHRLQQTIELGMLIDQKFSYALEREIPAEDPRRRFIEDEILFPLRQRIQDLQQQLAVNQQGVLAIEIIIRNNKELVKGVDRGIHVTINALNVAVTVALALANQRIVLDKIDAVNKTTNRLIAQTASQLRTQGTEIHKRASSTQLDMETLKKAFVDINAALDDISSFRKQALPQMAGSILEMDALTKATEAAIQRMEEGTRAEPVVSLDIA